MLPASFLLLIINHQQQHHSTICLCILFYSLYSVVLILFMSHHHLAVNLGDKLYASVCESVFTTIITIISLSPVSSPHSLDALRLSTIKTLQCQDDLHETVVIYS